MNAIRLLPVIYFAAHGSALGGISELCTWEPMLPVKAGSDISVKIQNPWGDECRAELEFADDKFPKMAWLFKATDCVDLQLAEFKVPSGAPNGDAYLTWQCDGDVPMSCIHIVISNGKGDLVSPTPRPKTETARCVPSTTFLTDTVSRGGEKPTGVFLDTRSFNPTATTVLSTPVSEALDSAATSVATDVSALTTVTKSSVNTPSLNSFVGAGGSRRAGETSAQLPTDTSTIATPTTNTAPVTTITGPVTTNTAPVTAAIADSITTTTTTTTTLDDSTNEPSYITVTATITTCPVPMKRA